MNENAATHAVLHDLFYLPNVAYFSTLLDTSCVYVDTLAPYRKQTYRNRCQILLANKVERLTVPVKVPFVFAPYASVQIDYNQRWKANHLRSIQSAYGKAPFFEYFYPELEKVFEQNRTYLLDLNRDLLTACLKMLQLPCAVVAMEGVAEDLRAVDLQGLVQAKGATKKDQEFHPVPYRQVFGSGFIPNLSIIDLLFCTGPEASDILRRSRKKIVNKR
ncbi:MAG: WbqC family protein [Nitritalea sp.]